jgi:hypothetical protein
MGANPLGFGKRKCLPGKLQVVEGDIKCLLQHYVRISYRPGGRHPLRLEQFSESRNAIELKKFIRWPI